MAELDSQILQHLKKLQTIWYKVMLAMHLIISLRSIINAVATSIPKASSTQSHRKPHKSSDCRTNNNNNKQKSWAIFRIYLYNANYILYKIAKTETRRVWCKIQRESSWIWYISNIMSNAPNKNICKRVKHCMGLYF